MFGIWTASGSAWAPLFAWELVSVFPSLLRGRTDGAGWAGRCRVLSSFLCLPPLAWAALRAGVPGSPFGSLSLWPKAGLSLALTSPRPVAQSCGDCILAPQRQRPPKGQVVSSFYLCTFNDYPSAPSKMPRLLRLCFPEDKEGSVAGHMAFELLLLLTLERTCFVSCECFLYLLLGRVGWGGGAERRWVRDEHLEWPAPPLLGVEGFTLQESSC